MEKNKKKVTKKSESDVYVPETKIKLGGTQVIEIHIYVHQVPMNPYPVSPNRSPYTNPYPFSNPITC